MSMRNDHIDALIDDAARRLTAGEPSSALRGVVRDRIGTGRSAGWSFAPALVGVSLVVLAIVGRALLGPPGERDNVRPTLDRASTPPGESAPQVPGLTATQPERIEARQFTRRLAEPVAPPPVEEESPIPPIVIEPLATVPLGAVQIAVDVSSGVMPIEIAPLQIEPLLGQ
jgi:hypothetical protein